MNSFWKSCKKLLRTAIIIFVGVVIAGLEVKYPTLMGYKIINEYTVVGVLYLIYDQLKHNLLRKLP